MLVYLNIQIFFRLFLYYLFEIILFFILSNIFLNKILNQFSNSLISIASRNIDFQICIYKLLKYFIYIN